jgi:hypothetical protein
MRHNVGVILIITTDQLFIGEADLVGTLNVFVRQSWGTILRPGRMFSVCIELFDAKILYLLNDSVLGPTNDAAFLLLQDCAQSGHHWS